jgi:chlorophyll synthase
MARMATASFATPSALPAAVELLKPITWFPPMWAYVCGVVSVGDAWSGGRWPLLIVGLLVAGPLVCGTSQAVNDWFDRHVDAINEPKRPIPSGRLPGRTGLYIAIAWTLLSLGVATLLGPWGFGATVFGLALAWAYSAPPLRLKKNGWWGNSAVAICYEGLPWFTAAAIGTGTAPNWHVLVLAALYSFGAHGIMTLNDFKSVAGDRRMGVGSLPVRMGEDGACALACFMMAAPQIVVIGLLFGWGQPMFAWAIGILLLVQLVLMEPLLENPRERAPWYNATGITLYVLGMLVSAFAVRTLAS